jgi:hypothetical protein
MSRFSRLTLRAFLLPDGVIAGVKPGADNPILALPARGSSKFRFNLRDGSRAAVPPRGRTPVANGERASYPALQPKSKFTWAIAAHDYIACTSPH